MIEQAWNFVWHQIQSNQFLAGGFVLGIIAAILHQAKSMPGRAWSKLKSLFFIEVTVSDRDETFLWMVKWLSLHPYSRQKARLLMATSERVPDDTDNDGIARPAGQVQTHYRDTRPRILLSPAKGHHWFFYKGRIVFLYRGKDEDSSGNSNSTDKKSFFSPENITIKVFGRRRAVIMELLEEARDQVHPKGERRTTIMLYRYNGWSSSLVCRPRPLDSVILRAGLIEEMIAAIEAFRKDSEWYFSKGIPWRLGILLSGPPGSGKSSTIAAIASHFDMDLAIVNLSATSTDDDDVRNMLSSVPKNAQLMIEDVDCVFDQREGSEDKNSQITFSGLLNAIDGVAAGEGRILWMTTNHPEKLDPALIRPGRADLKFTIVEPDVDQVRRMFHRFHPKATDAQLTRFMDAIGDPSKISMAALQGILIAGKADPEAAIRGAETK